MGSSQQPQDLRQIYHHIIDDVVAKMKPGFLQESVDESVLQTIRQRWAQKLTEKGVISDPEPQAQPDSAAVGIKRDEDLSRKRPYDGLAPNNRQEAAAAAAGAGPSGMNMPMKGGPMHMQMRPAGQAAPGGPGGMRPAHQQMPMGRGMGAGGITNAQHQQALIQIALQMVQHLPPAQRQGALQAQLQALQHSAQLQVQAGAGGMPGQPQVGAGMRPLNQGLPAGQQLQNLQNLRAPGLPPQVLAAQQQQQHQQLQHHLMQQQAIQQQQQQALQRMQQGLPAGLPGGMPTNLQLLQQQGVVKQQQQQQQQQQRIPQGDGSADLPPSVAEVAAAAGMQPDQLRAMLPSRIAAIFDRNAGASSSSMSVPAAAAGQAAVAADVASLPAAGAVAGRAGGGAAAGGRGKPRRRRHGTTIPQVDGNGDDEEEEEDFVGDYEGGDDDAGAGDDGEDDNGEEESGSQDEQELAKFTAELDDLEEADKEETGDVGFALYEKVHRAKNRWRCNLRYGVFLINGKEYMFNKGSTDFTF